jgi:DNA-binding IclR family transcriptional regulator
MIAVGPHTKILQVLRQYSPKSISVGYIAYLTQLSPNQIYTVINYLQQQGISITISDDGEEQITLQK